MEFTVPNERTLRKITIASVVPAIPLTIAAGCMSDQVYTYYYSYDDPPPIFFGLIPIVLSAIFSYIYIGVANSSSTSNSDDPESEHGNKKSKREMWWLGLDWLLTFAHFAILIPVWVLEPPKLNGHANWMMLESYATCFMMSNMFIHGYLAVYRSYLFHCSENPKECPHCHQSLNVITNNTRQTSEGYSLIRGDDLLSEGGNYEDSPRQSMAKEIEGNTAETNNVEVV